MLKAMDSSRNQIIVEDDDQATVTVTYYDNQAIPQSITLTLHDLIERLLNNTIAS